MVTKNDQAEHSYEYQPRHENGPLLDWAPLPHAENDQEARDYCEPRGFEWRRALPAGMTVMQLAEERGSAAICYTAEQVRAAFDAGRASIIPVAAPEAPTLPDAKDRRIMFLEGLVRAYGPKSLQYDIEHPNDGLNAGDAPEAPATEQQATGDGFALSFSREDWGVIFDGVMLEIERSEKRKQANAESNSDARAVQGRAILTSISDASHATPAATTASASEERVIGGQRWSKEAEMVESWCATAPSCNADWQSGYKTGYETGLGDGRAEFTNPAATSPAERAALAATEKKEQK